MQNLESVFIPRMTPPILVRMSRHSRSDLLKAENDNRNTLQKINENMTNQSRDIWKRETLVGSDDDLSVPNP